MMQIKALWRNSPVLTATMVLMIFDLAICGIGLVFDSTIVTGAPAWLKPAKFAISTALLTGTLAWLYGYLTPSRRLSTLAYVACAGLIVEIAIIDIQAARGTASHFNQTTPLNEALFQIMGIGIGLIWLSMVGMTAAFFRQAFTSKSFGWAVRLGMLITTLGSAASGGLMIAPNADQRTQMAHRQPVPVMGSHTVGAPDGGLGMPGTDWSVEHGDLRVPHFLALHALQVIPFFALIIPARMRSERRGTGLVSTAAVSYLLLTVLLTWQALRGEPVIHPSDLTLAAFGVWSIATAVATLVLLSPNRTPALPPATHGAAA